jgi:formamidopyrimidine-DNA glycosylase
MPELPEVETVVSELRDALIGRTITAVTVRWARTVAMPDPTTFAAALCGRSIGGVTRRGKWVALSLEPAGILLIHLRMSGRLLLEAADGPEESHTRVVLGLDNGQRLRFSDPRKFGRMALVDQPECLLGGLGPEPLAEDFTAERLAQMLGTRRTRIKPLLLDQRFLAGLGNIYTDEALWQAGIHPLRPANSLSAAEVACLHQAIRQVLTAAVAARGTTLEDTRYVGPNGVPGEFAARLAVYGHAGQPCPRCGTPITRCVVGGRGTYICPQCQSEKP